MPTTPPTRFSWHLAALSPTHRRERPRMPQRSGPLAQLHAMPPLPLSASAPMCEGSCSRDADHRCRSSPRPERGVGDADRRWRGGVAKARSSPPVVARASGCNTPTSLCQYRPAPPQLRPWSLLAPRFVPRLPAHNLHQPNLTITLRYPRATLQPYCPLRHYQSLPSTVSSTGGFVIVTGGASPVTKPA